MTAEQCGHDARFYELRRRKFYSILQSVPRKFVAMFDGIIWTPSRDLEGNVIGPIALNITTPTVLALEHDASQPVGLLLSITRHDRHVVIGRFGLADCGGKGVVTAAEMLLDDEHWFLSIHGCGRPVQGEYRTLEIFEVSLTRNPGNRECRCGNVQFM